MGLVKPRLRARPPATTIAEIDQRLLQLRATWLHGRRYAHLEGGAGVDLTVVCRRMDVLLEVRHTLRESEESNGRS